MMRIILIIFLFLSSKNVFSQEEYSSKEEDAYYKNRHFVYFKPIDKDLILNFSSKGINFKEIIPNQFFPIKQSNQENSDIESIYKESDSLKMNFGKVYPESIKKFYKNRNFQAFIYTAYDFGESDIWIAVSRNEGKNWNYYYTGLIEKEPVQINTSSDLPLIKDPNTLQVECSLMRQIAQGIHPTDPAKYETVKDHLYIEFALDELSKDFDQDGLTDILEEKLHTDSHKKDTDNDGIDDNLDLNPRFNLWRNAKTTVYEALLEDDEWSWDDRFIPNKVPKKNIVSNNTRTELIITEDPEILSIQPQQVRVIILSQKEYEKSFSLWNDSDVGYITLSPFFKVNKRNNTYLLNKSAKYSSTHYLVTKMASGWKIRVISAAVD